MSTPTYERRTDHINLTERLTKQEILMTVVRDDVSEIKAAIVGDGCNNGLVQRVVGLETSHIVIRSWLRGIAWVIGLALTAAGVAAAVWKS